MSDSFLKNYLRKNVGRFFSTLKERNVEIKIKPFTSILIKTPFSINRIAEISFANKEGRQKRYLFIKKSPNSKKEFKNFQIVKKLAINKDNKMFPYIFDWIASQGVLIEEFIYPSRNLLYEFLKINLPFKNLEASKELISKLARHLAAFQNRYLSRKRNISLESYLADIEALLKRLPCFSTAEKRKIMDKFKQEALKIKILPQVFSIDLSLRNSLFVPPRIIFTDLETLKENHPYYDIHSLLVNLESRTRHPLIFPTNFINQLKKHFLKVYKNNCQFDFSQQAYNLTRFFYLVSYLDHYYHLFRRGSLFKKMPFWLIFIRKLKQEIRNYAGL